MGKKEEIVKRVELITEKPDMTKNLKGDLS